MTAADFRTGVEAAAALLLGRPGALGRFDVSLEGFWRSFAAILLVLPSFALSVLADGRMQIDRQGLEAPEFDWSPFMALRLVVLAIDWVALPLLLALTARRLGIAGGYVPFVVVRNWATVVVAALYAVPALLFSAGVIGAELAFLLSLAILAVALHFHYRIARHALGVPISMAIGVVVLDLVLGLLIFETVSRLASA